MPAKKRGKIRLTKLASCKSEIKFHGGRDDARCEARKVASQSTYTWKASFNEKFTSSFPPATLAVGKYCRN